MNSLFEIKVMLTFDNSDHWCVNYVYSGARVVDTLYSLVVKSITNHDIDLWSVAVVFNSYTSALNGSSVAFPNRTSRLGKTFMPQDDSIRSTIKGSPSPQRISRSNSSTSIRQYTTSTGTSRVRWWRKFIRSCKSQRVASMNEYVLYYIKNFVSLKDTSYCRHLHNECTTLSVWILQ